MCLWNCAARVLGQGKDMAPSGIYVPVNYATSQSWHKFYKDIALVHVLISSTNPLNLVPSNHLIQRRWWHPTPVLLPGKSHGQRSLVGCSPWDPKESDTVKWLTHLIILSSFLSGCHSKQFVNTSIPKTDCNYSYSAGTSHSVFHTLDPQNVMLTKFSMVSHWINYNTQ